MLSLLVLWMHAASAQTAADTQPVPTVTGVPRFTGPEVEDPSATPALLDRLLHSGESSEVRVALIDAIVRSGGAWSAPLAAAFPTETDPKVRRMMAEVMRRADAGPARTTLTLAAQDPVPEVRAAAMRAISGRADGAAMGGLVLAALADSDASVRAFAARATGWLDLKEGWAPLLPLLHDPDAAVRVSALRALERLDPVAVRKLPVLGALALDPDPTVARTARMLGSP